MSRGTGTFLAMLACGLLAVVVFFLFASGEKIYLTPQEAFEASRTALVKNDMRSWCQCLTDEARDLIAAKLAISEYATNQQVEKKGADQEKAKAKAVTSILDNYGLTRKHMEQVFDEGKALMGGAPMKDQVAIAQVVLAPVSDRNGLVADMFQTLMKGQDGENPMVEELKDAVLTDVKISGKTAEGKISRKGEEGGGSPLLFRKQGEGWRIDLFAGQERPPAPRPGFQHP
jgi:hypothetical protein